MGVFMQQGTRTAIIERLERGFQEVQDSERFQDYLSTCARFHHYSAHNTLLIWTQRPDATRVAGFHTWRKLGRHVLKGEKGIGILAPRPYKRTVDNGDEEEVIEGCYFKPVHVFDVSQTDGQPLPDAPVTELDGSDDGLFASLSAIATKEGIALDRTPNASSANGFYRPGQIWIKPEASPRMATKTLAHELAHHFAGHNSYGACRGEMETVAEAVAYIVLAHVGIDAGSYSFGYLASWSDPKVFRAKLTEIHATANQIIDRLEGEANDVHARAA
jgi:antirestriction protein ArdC